MFGLWKALRKEKKNIIKKNDYFIFIYPMENVKKNQI